MNKVAELFGIFCNKKSDVKEAVASQMCPYSGKKCYKTNRPP